jgi:hypothetical protein
MAKSIVCFSFPGNIVWYPPAEDNWAKILVEYVKRELEIGSGTFVSIKPCLAKNRVIDSTFTESFQKHLHVEIICDIPEWMMDDKLAIRARVITLLEDTGFDFIKFHNCGPGGNLKISTDNMQPV